MCTGTDKLNVETKMRLAYPLESKCKPKLLGMDVSFSTPQPDFVFILIFNTKSKKRSLGLSTRNS